MGRSIGIRLKARISPPSYFWKGGTASVRGGRPVNWHRVGGKEGQHAMVTIGDCSCSLSLSDEILMSLWICSSKNILARGYQCRIYKYIRDMQDMKLHALTKTMLLRHRQERRRACV